MLIRSGHPTDPMEYEHVTVVLDDDTIAGIEVEVGPGRTVEDFVEEAIAEQYGDGETVDDPVEDG
jgi:hypothetical protein